MVIIRTPNYFSKLIFLLDKWHSVIIINPFVYDSYVHVHKHSYCVPSCFVFCCCAWTPKLQEDSQFYMRYYGGFSHVDLAHLAKPGCWMPRKQKEESTLSENRLGKKFQPSLWQTRKLKQRQDTQNLNKMRWFRKFQMQWDLFIQLLN